MGQVKLESFEDDALLAELPDEGFAQGFTEGHAAGLAAAKAEQAALAHELVQSIADLQFKYEEARGEMIRGMGPLFAALTEKVFPQCIAEDFADRVVALLLDKAAVHAGNGLTLRIHPQHKAAVTAACEAAEIDVAVVSDASLQPHAAWITHEAGAYHIDYDQLIDDIREILSSVDVIQPRSETHG